MPVNNKNNNLHLFIKAIILTVLPFFSCLFNLAVQGKTFSGISLLSSDWNDEIYYFKQVEAVLKAGIPRGPFGYNESASKLLTFGAWNPLILLPWIIWGAVFGWTLVSPYIFNIVFWGVCLAIACFTLKPGYKQVITICILSLANPLFARYLLSSMPEAYIWGLTLVFYAIAISELSHPVKWKRILMFAIGVFLTLVRPYMALLIILTFYSYMRRQSTFKNRLKIFLICVIVILSLLLIYFLSCSFFTSEYFDSIIRSDWIDTFKSLGLFAGIKELFGEIVSVLKDIYYRMYKTVTQNMIHGTYYILFTVVICIYIIGFISLLVRKIKNKTNQDAAKLIAAGHFLISALLVFMAVIIMYNIEDGDRHLLLFCITGIFLLPLLLGNNSTTSFWSWDMLPEIMLIGIFVWLVWIKCAGNAKYFTPTCDAALTAKADAWEEIFNNNMTITENSGSHGSYDNVVDLLFCDETLIENYEDYSVSEPGELKWQYFYEIPAGYGISICSGSYLEENLETLKAGYVGVVSGGHYDELFSKSTLWTEAGRDDDVAFFKKNALYQ